METIGGMTLKRPITNEVKKTVLEDLAPEIHEIKDPKLKQLVVDAWALSCCSSSFKRITDIPGWGGPDDFYLKRGNQADHLRGVARFSMLMADDMVKHYPEVIVDRDICIAGALCHDIGKSYELDPVNQTRWKADPSASGDPTFRHSIYGVHIALTAGLPEVIAHICMGHSLEGQFVTLSTECMVVRHADHVWWYIGCSMGLLEPKSIGIAGPKMKPRKLRTELNQAAE